MGWTRWRAWRTESGEVLRVGWRPGGDAGAKLGAEEVAFWPEGAVRRGALSVPDSELRVDLPGPDSEVTPAAWSDVSRLPEVSGSATEMRLMGHGLLAAPIVDAIAFTSWLASFYVDAWFLLIRASMLLFLSIATSRGHYWAAVAGAGLLIVDSALWTLANVVVGWSLCGSVPRLVLCVHAVWRLGQVFRRRSEERRMFPGPTPVAPGVDRAAPPARDASNPFTPPGGV
ncbi:MAG: hypothetical protein ACI8PZ_004959 [Myxococcota bacterium]|jgi:hypothetical protein